MINALEFIIGLAIGTGFAALYYFARVRGGGPQTERYRLRMRQALTIFGVSAVLAIAGRLFL
jgi:hypothetical protein